MSSGSHELNGPGRFLMLLLVIVAYLVFGLGFAILTPDWQNPDEPAHYNYIRQLAENGRLPVLQTEDYDQVYLEEIIRQGFPPDRSIDPLRYENHQPPLYYLLAVPFYNLQEDRVLPIRLFSLLLGAGLIVLTYLACRTAVPDRPMIATGAATFAALLPQHTAMMASVNNDALAGLLMALILWLALRERLHLSGGRTERAVLGLAVGLALLTKLTVAISYPVAALALLLRLREERSRPPATGTRLDVFLVLVLPLLLVLPWWLRNLSVYGWPDFLGLIRHGAAVAAQPQTGDWIAAHGLADWLHRLFTFTFQSFWGQFGWMALPMRPAVYRVLLVFCCLLSVGLLLARSRNKGRSVLAGGAATPLLLSAGLTLLAYIWYNFSFVQHQGRYLYSALVSISLAASLGWQGLLGRTGEKYPWFSFLGFYGFLSVLNLYVFVFVIRLHAW